MKAALKKTIPTPLWRAAGETYDAIRRLPEVPRAYFHPWRRESIRKLAALKDIHRGERCFIIGNGPSLRQTDVSRLKNEYTFGLNRIYMAFEDWGFSTTYFVSINDLVIEQTAADIQNLKMPKFITWRARHWLQMDENMHFLYTSYTGAHFNGNAAGRLYEGATVTNIALQVAFHLGFKQVYLIGMDHNFQNKGTPNATVVSEGDDPNHFDPKYFAKGFRWQLPDLETSERGYRLAREAYLQDSRQVLNATIGGKLEVFPRVSYDSLFSA